MSKGTTMVNTLVRRLGSGRRGLPALPIRERKSPTGTGIRIKDHGRSRRRELPMPSGQSIWEMLA